MAEEDIFIECAKEASKSIAKDAYQDTGKPVLKPTGELLGLIPRTIKAVLLPLEKWVVGREYNLAETQKLLQQKLENIPPEQIVSPEAHIAVPAIQYISYCMDNEELRNMYANLLSSSMIKVVKKGVHPCYLEIIKQLNPDEAKILKYFYYHKTIPIISFIKKDTNGNFSYALRDFSNIGEKSGCEFPYLLNRQFNNLTRLGLVDKAPEKRRLSRDYLYQELLENDIVKKLKKNILDNSKYIDIIDEKSFMAITPFGENFCSICIDEPSKNSILSQY